MSTEPNIYRTENYQNYINSLYKKTRVEKSISDVQKKIDDDNDSLNSVAESLNNYLDVKVGVARNLIDYLIAVNFEVTHYCCFRSLMITSQWCAASQSPKAKRNRRLLKRRKMNRCSGEKLFSGDDGFKCLKVALGLRSGRLTGKLKPYLGESRQCPYHSSKLLSFKLSLIFCWKHFFKIKT